MSDNEDSSDYRLDRKDYPYFTEDEFNTFRVEEKEFVEKVHLSCKKRYETRIAKFNLNSRDLNIVICGKAGSGKSATANAILGRKAFTANSSSNSVTQVSLDNTCIYKKRKITVVDTPGIFATDRDNADVKKELARKAFLLKDGVHCFIICMSASESRFTKDLIEMLQLIKQDGRGHFFDYCMLVYTKAETELETCTLREFLEKKEENEHNRRLLRNINNRVVAVNNKCLVPAEALRNRDALVEMVDFVVAGNIQNGKPDIFTDDLFKAAGKLQKKLTAVVQENSFPQEMVNATIEVIIRNAPSKLPYDAFLEEVISILKKREKSEESNQTPDLFITGTDSISEKYVKQIHQIYVEIQPEVVRFMDILVAATAAAAAATVGGAVAAVGGGAGAVAAGAAAAAGIIILLI